MWTTLVFLVALAAPPQPLNDVAVVNFRTALPPAAPTTGAPKPGAAGHAAASAPIQDNSFLVEEAYNQEPGVVQHISTLQRSRTTGDWVYTFTEEWPAGGLKHQLSVTLPLEHIRAAPDGRSAPGDVALNYRYQLAGDGTAAVAIAPRFTILLPSGDARQRRGAGAPGYQVNVPISVVLSPSFVTHVNLGATVTPGSRGADLSRARTSAVNFGQSFIWLARPSLNPMIEFAFNSAETVTGPGRTERVNSCYLNPGLRWAINVRGGLQIVPGVSVPIGVASSRGERALFFYLSFEHPLWKAK